MNEDPRAPLAPAEDRRNPLGPVQIALVYAVCSALWILFSDRALVVLFSDPAQIALASAVKGWVFTAVTAVLLYGLLRRRTTPDVTSPARPTPARVALRAAVVVLATAGLVAAATAYSVERHRQIEIVRLRAVADLKVQQVTAWIAERTMDARMLAAGSDAAEQVHRWREPAAAGGREPFLARLEQLRALTQFRAITLLDAGGETLWHSDGPPHALNAQGIAERAQIARQRQVRRAGPYLDAAGHAALDILVPLPAPGLADDAPAPLLAMHLDAQHFLPAQLHEWPIPSSTGEVVLVRRDGDAVLFLNALKRSPDAALKLRQPFGDKRLLSVQLIEAGAPGDQVLDGVNYVGAAAFGVGRKVPDTDWYLLAKMDRSELYGPAVNEALWIVLAGALTLFVAASGVYLARQRHELNLAAHARQAQEERLRALGLLTAIVESSDDAIFAKDALGRYTLFNRAAGRLAAQAPQDVIGRDDSTLFPPEQAAMLRELDRRVVAQDQIVTGDETLSLPDGTHVFLATKGPLRDGSGAIIGSFGISRDITHVKRVETALRRANRALLASRECGHAVMRAHDEVELLREVCGIVVQTGGYAMAWVGYAENDAAHTVRAVAQSGDAKGYLDTVVVSWGDNERGHGPTGTAIRERRPVIARDLRQDSGFAPWRDEASRRGFVSSIAVPLMPDVDTCIGALGIYAVDAQAFDDEEVHLVAQLANDLAYGIRTLRDRQARREAQQALREQKDRLAESQRIARVGSWQIDWPSQRLSWSDETFALYGLAPDHASLTPEKALWCVVPEDVAACQAWLAQLHGSAAASDFVYRITLPDGGVRALSARATLERDAAGQPWRMVGTVQDITELRRAEAERLAQEARYRELFASNPHPMWVYDRQSLAFLEVNDAAVAKYGWSRAEFLAMGIDCIRPAADVPRLLEHIRHTVAGQDEDGTWQHCLKDGSVIEVEISAHSLNWGGQPAVVVLAHDVTAQVLAEVNLRTQARRAEALLQLPELAEDLPEIDFMQRAQGIAEDLTGSCIAFIHFVNPDGETIELVTWSRRTLEQFCTAVYDTHYPVSEAGIWAESLRLRKPVVFNDYAGCPYKRGLPEGHAPLTRLVSVPVIEGGRVVMLTGVGGKGSDYTDLDVETVQLLSNETWRLVQRRRADAALQQSEQSYRTLTEQVPAIIYRAALDDASTTTYISPAVQALGYSPTEWLADPNVWVDSLHPEDRERVLASLHTAEQAGSGIDVEYRLRTRSGEWRRIHDKAEVVRDNAGQPLFLQGLMLDVTRRLEAESELRKLYQAVEQSPNSVVITNLKAEIEYVNAAFLAATGYTREEVIGRNPRILQAPDVKPEERATLWAALSQGLPWKGEFRNQRKDGSVYVELAHVAPLRQPDGTITHYVGVKEDITEKKRIGDELDRYRQHLEELVHARTVELADARRHAEAANLAKTAFLANMSHEIRTPMNAIVGLSYLLHRDHVTPAQAARLEKIEAAALHLLSIINGILDLSKIEAGKVALEEADFPLSTVLDAVMALIADRAQAKGVAVHLENHGVPPWLHGDATRLRQALLNYADNALKFTAHGSICLRSRLLEERDGALRVRLEVQDTGIGIQPDELPRLFQAFEQADASTTRRYGGTGLGLALTRRLAALMGGETGVDSQPGAGSTFWLTAWLQPGKSPPPTERRREPRDAEAALRRHGAGARVLLAEDDAVNREVATELLQATGIVVDTATDGREAVRKASTQHYDLVLMDMQMPVMDGFDATRALRALPTLAALPILAMTGNAFAEDRQACLDAGMNDFVPKPVDPQLLYGTLLRWLPRRAATAADAADGLPRPPFDSEAALRAALDRVDGLDSRQGLAAMRGDLRAYLHLLHSLAAHHGPDAERLAGLVAAGQHEAARQLAHQLRGAAGALGATGLRDAATALEVALRQQQPASGLPALCDAVRARSGSLVRELACLKEQPGAAPAGGGQAMPEADPAQVMAVLTELEPLVASDDTAAATVYATHRNLLHAALGAAAGALGRQLEAYDFRSALQTLLQAAAAFQDAHPVAAAADGAKPGPGARALP